MINNLGNGQVFTDFKADVVIGQYTAGKREPSLFQLPIDPINFTGRESEVNAIAAQLDQPGIKFFAFFGMGGVGKSALAIHIAHQLKSRYADAQLWVDLRGQAEQPLTPEAALQQVLVEGFGEEPQHLPLELEGLQRRYRSCLASIRGLIVLDNARDAAQVQPLLPGSGNCAVLVTSRERLQLQEIPTENAFPLGVLSELEALALLGKIVGKAGVPDAPAQELVQLCGCLPLAIQVVGALLREVETGLGLAQLVAELRDERGRLRKLRVETPEGKVLENLDVEASLSLSYRRLTATQQQVLTRVAVLRGQDFGVVLAAVLGAVDQAEVATVLTQLCRFQLLMQDEGRYRFHDLVRLFARGQLEPVALTELAVQALGWYNEQAGIFDSCLEPKYRRQMAESLVTEGGQPLETIELALEQRGLGWFAAERENLVDAVAWAQAIGEHPTAVRLARNLTTFFMRRSLWSDWVTTHQVALASANEMGDRHGIAQTLNNLGGVYQAQGKWQAAITCYEQSLETDREIGDRHSIARTLNNLGGVYQAQGKWQAAITCYEQSLETDREMGDRHGIAQTLNNLGGVYKAQGKWQEAITCYEQSLETNREMGDRHGIAQTLNNLGVVYKAQGKWQEAITCYEQSLETNREMGDRHGIAKTMNNLGVVYQAQGKWQEALTCYEQSLQTLREIGDSHGIAQTMNNLGVVYQAQGKWQEALTCYEQSLQTLREIGDSHGIAQTMNNLGMVYQAQGKWQEALTCYEQSLETYREIGDSHGIAQTMGNLGMVYQAQGKWQEALTCYEQSLETFRALGDPLGEATTWFNLGEAQAKLGNINACTSYQNAKALYTQLDLTSNAENCDQAIADLDKLTSKAENCDRAIADLDKLTSKAENCDRAIADLDKLQKAKSFPYWQTATIVLLVSWFLYQTLKPQPPQPAPSPPPTQNR